MRDPHDLSHLVAAVQLMSDKLCNNKLVLKHKCSMKLYKHFFPAKSIIHKMTEVEFKIVFAACHISTTLSYFSMPWICQIKDIEDGSSHALRESQEIASAVLSYFMDGSNATELAAVVDMFRYCIGRMKNHHINDNYFYKHWHRTMPDKVDKAIVEVVENMPSEFFELLNCNNAWIEDLMSMSTFIN